MKRVWVCQWEIARGKGPQAEEYDSFSEEVKNFDPNVWHKSTRNGYSIKEMFEENNIKFIDYIYNSI